jgi:hypothetical protein
MRFLYFDTTVKKSEESEEPKSNFWRKPRPFAVAALVVATIWLLVGSIAYPLFWFEFVFKSGFHNWALWAYGFEYLLQHVSWLYFGLPIAACAILFVTHLWYRGISAFLMRHGFLIIMVCLIACFGDAYELNRTQRFNYEVSFGLRKIVDATLDLEKALVEMALPPARIVPPVDFLYVDAGRVNTLYSELQPDLVEHERKISTERKAENSIGIERKPIEVKKDGETKTTEEHNFIATDPTVAKRTILLINNLLARDAPPYYSSLAASGSFQLLSRIRQDTSSFQKSLKIPSLFLGQPDTVEAKTLKQMAEARKKTPPETIEAGVRQDLKMLSGLVIAHGEFKRSVVGKDSVSVEEVFKPAPNPILFRCSIHDRKAISLMLEHSILLVLGEAIKPWDGSSAIEVFPVAVLFGAGK